MNDLWLNLLDYLDDYTLIFCVRCNRLRFKKDTRPVQHLIWGWVRLCNVCHVELYGKGD